MIFYILLLFLWPLSLLIENSFKNFLLFSLPTLLLLISFILFKRKSSLWIILLFMVVLFNFRELAGNSIFRYDNDERNAVIQKSYLYPNIYLPRVFQNKLNVYWDKFSFNLFALTDPNNYFFNFHPREIQIDNQNLAKFPFLAITFFILGLYTLPKNPYRKFLLITIPLLILSLSFLKNFDRYDFILYIPLSIIILSGLSDFRSRFKKHQKILLAIFLIFTITQYLHLIVRSFIK